MKNLKKVLALVMAFTMAFTMMATAGAAYTDQADIEATEAVDMLNAIGVMTGDPDGSFRPNDTITRAEACRMIYTIRTNSDNADAYKNMQTTFKDVPSDAWYAGYVKHCQAANIVSGTSATTFEPNRDVTGVELALMCLRVMGYDPAKADIGGSTWSTKTIGLATEAGLLDGVNTPVTSACPRQWAAQIMYNTIDARTVRWSNDSETYTDLDMGGNKMERVGKKYMKLYVNVGTLTSVKGDDLTISMSKSDEADSDTLQQSFTKVGADYSSLLGNKVKVLFRDGKANDVIGVYAVEDNSSYTVNMKDVDQDGDKVKFDGKSYSFDESKLEVQTLNVDGTSKTESVTSAFFKTDDNATKTQTVTFVDNDGDGKLNAAFITVYETAEVTYVGSDRITAGKTYKMEDENIAEDIAKDDWAVISYNRFDDCKNIVKAEVVTDTLNSSKSKTGYKQFEIGSTWYNIKDDEANNVSVGDKVKAYVVSGVIVKIDTDDGTGAIPTNIAVVVGQGSGTLEGDQVKLRFFDGTVKTVTLDDKGDVKTAGNAPLGQSYKVSGPENNTRLDNLDKGNKYNGYYYGTKTDGKANLTADATPDSDTIGGVKVDDNAVVILYTAQGNSKKITGKQYNLLKNSDINNSGTGAVGSAFTKSVNGLDRVMLAAVKVDNTNVSGTSYDNYAYIVEDGSEKANGDIAFTMWTGSENVSVLWENGDAKKLVKGTLVAYSSIDENKYVQDGAVIGTLKEIVAKGEDTAFGSDNFYAGKNKADAAKSISIGDKSLNVTANTHVLVLDTDADKSENIGLAYTYGDKLATAAKTKDQYHFNVVYRMEDGATSKDGEDLDLLVIDSTGAFDFDKPESSVDPKPEPGNELKDPTKEELKDALSKGDVTATGVIPGDTYISSNTLTLKNAVVSDTVNVVGNVVIDGAITKLGSGKVEIANGSVTFKNGAKVSDVTLNNVTSITDENASTTAADVNTMLSKTSTVTVKDVSDALTVNAAGKTLNLDTAKDTITVTAGTVNAKALTAGKAVNVAGTLNVASDTTLANTDTVTGTLVVTGKLTTTGACSFAGNVKASTISVGGSYTVAAGKTLELTAATAAAELEKVTGAAASAKFIHVGSSDTTTNNSAANSNTAKFYSDKGTLSSDGSSSDGTAATPAVDSDKIKAGTYVWNTTEINAGQADNANNQTALAAWLAE